MKNSRSIFITLLIVLNIAIDQITKLLVRNHVEFHKETPLIGDYFILTNVENSGAFLGMGSDLGPALKLILLLILPFVVLAAVVYYIYKTKTLDKLSLIGLSCIVGGGFANLYDRVLYGSVTDFLHLDLGGVFKTGIFNMADLSVTSGMIMILIASFIHRKKNS